MNSSLVAGQFSDTFVPIMDGVSIAARNYAYWLDKKYGTCYAIGPEVKGYEDHEEFTVLRYKSFPIPGFDPFRIGVPQIDRDFKKQLDKIDFTIVHAHCPFVSGILAAKIAEEKKVPLVATFHSKYREDFKTSLPSESFVEMAVKKVVRYYESADYVWVPAQNTAEILQEYGYRGSIEVMPNGTDMPLPPEDEYKQYRKKGSELFDAPEGEFVFLFVGQHRWVKNIKLIIEALNILNKRGRSFKMVFVGKGPDKKEMEQLVYRYGIWDKVFFTGIIIDREEIKPVYARANLFLFPSLYDNAPLVMREAAAFNVPSVVVRGTTAAETVTDGENGFLIENDAEEFVDMLEALMDEPDRIEQAGLGAQQSIYLSWEDVIDTVYTRYCEILEEWTPGK
jgi:1,2-diacylglycerol 3-alpha-glucosyltransferase